MLGAAEGAIVTIESVALPKGSFCKIQPHETKFIEVSNPKAVLERALSKLACLTQGDTLSIEYVALAF